MKRGGMRVFLLAGLCALFSVGAVGALDINGVPLTAASELGGDLYWFPVGNDEFLVRVGAGAHPITTEQGPQGYEYVVYMRGSARAFKLPVGYFQTKAILQDQTVKGAKVAGADGQGIADVRATVTSGTDIVQIANERTRRPAPSRSDLYPQGLLLSGAKAGTQQASAPFMGLRAAPQPLQGGSSAATSTTPTATAANPAMAQATMAAAQAAAAAARPTPPPPPPAPLKAQPALPPVPAARAAGSSLSQTAAPIGSFWLALPDGLGEVLIKPNVAGELPSFSVASRARNFDYVSEDGRVLPAGLFRFKSDAGFSSIDDTPIVRAAATARPFAYNAQKNKFSWHSDRAQAAKAWITASVSDYDPSQKKHGDDPAELGRIAQLVAQAPSTSGASAAAAAAQNRLPVQARAQLPQQLPPPPPPASIPLPPPPPPQMRIPSFQQVPAAVPQVARPSMLDMSVTPHPAAPSPDVPINQPRSSLDEEVVTNIVMRGAQTTQHRLDTYWLALPNSSDRVLIRFTDRSVTPSFTLAGTPKNFEYVEIRGSKVERLPKGVAHYEKDDQKVSLRAGTPINRAMTGGRGVAFSTYRGHEGYKLYNFNEQSADKAWQKAYKGYKAPALNPEPIQRWLERQQGFSSGSGAGSSRGARGLPDSSGREVSRARTVAFSDRQAPALPREIASMVPPNSSLRRELKYDLDTGEWVLPKWTFFEFITGMRETDWIKLTTAQRRQFLFYDAAGRQPVVDAQDRLQQSPDGSLPRDFDRVAYVPEGQTYYIRNSLTGQLFCCGRLTISRLDELRRQCEGRRMPGGGSLQLMRGEVQDLQVTDGVGSAVQLASKFHTLESRINPTDAQERNGLTVPADNYGFLKNGDEESSVRAVQGENGAISAAAGYIFKTYFHEPTNLLEDMTDTQGRSLIPVDNEGNVFYRGQVPDLSRYLDSDDRLEVLTGRMKIPLLRDVQVTFGRSNFIKNAPRIDELHSLVTDPNRTVSQISCSAMSLKSETARHFGYDPSGKNEKAIAKIILYGMYEATLRMAFINGLNEVYLTLVGGNAFRNDPKWIYNAIAAQKEFIADSGLQVKIIFFEQTDTTAYEALVAEIARLAQSSASSSAAAQAAYAGAGAAISTAASSSAAARVQPDSAAELREYFARTQPSQQQQPQPVYSQPYGFVPAQLPPVDFVAQQQQAAWAAQQEQQRQQQAAWAAQQAALAAQQEQERQQREWLGQKMAVERSRRAAFAALQAEPLPYSELQANELPQASWAQTGPELHDRRLVWLTCKQALGSNAVLAAVWQGQDGFIPKIAQDGTANFDYVGLVTLPGGNLVFASLMPGIYLWRGVQAHAIMENVASGWGHVSIQLFPLGAYLNEGNPIYWYRQENSQNVTFYWLSDQGVINLGYPYQQPAQWPLVIDDYATLAARRSAAQAVQNRVGEQFSSWQPSPAAADAIRIDVNQQLGVIKQADLDERGRGRGHQEYCAYYDLWYAKEYLADKPDAGRDRANFMAQIDYWERVVHEIRSKPDGAYNTARMRYGKVDNLDVGETDKLKNTVLTEGSGWQRVFTMPDLQTLKATEKFNVGVAAAVGLFDMTAFKQWLGWLQAGQRVALILNITDTEIGRDRPRHEHWFCVGLQFDSAAQSCQATIFDSGSAEHYQGGDVVSAYGQTIANFVHFSLSYSPDAFQRAVDGVAE